MRVYQKQTVRLIAHKEEDLQSGLSLKKDLQQRFQFFTNQNHSNMDKQKLLDRMTLVTMLFAVGYFAMRIIVAWLSN